MTEQIIILDFGSQYTQVIARRIRECRVFSQILRFDTPASKLMAFRPSGLILSSGPASVYGMTADWVRLPYDLMTRLSTRIINEVKGRQPRKSTSFHGAFGAGRVCLDISSKPPSTIEWE